MAIKLPWVQARFKRCEIYDIFGNVAIVIGPLGSNYFLYPEENDDEKAEILTDRITKAVSANPSRKFLVKPSKVPFTPIESWIGGYCHASLHRKGGKGFLPWLMGTDKARIDMLFITRDLPIVGRTIFTHIFFDAAKQTAEEVFFAYCKDTGVSLLELERRK